MALSVSYTAVVLIMLVFSMTILGRFLARRLV